MSSFTLFNSTIPEVQRAMNSLSAILKKGEAAPNSASFLTARLAEDMLPLDFQIHFSTDLAQKVVHRLTGREPVAFARDEIKTFADAYARIEKVQKILDGAKADEQLINSYVDKTVPLGLGPGKTVNITGAAYVSGYAFPQLFFHVTTAYAILRKEGVPIGKQDYAAAFMGEFLQ